MQNSLNHNIAAGIKRENQSPNKMLSLPSHLNFDLVDADIDKTHPVKTIEYLLDTLKKKNIANGKKGFDQLSQKSLGAKPFTQTSNISLVGNVGINK